ncbi:MAG: FUSC family protein, partial [Sciscionella sp.]
MGWVGYYIALILEPTPTQLPMLLPAMVIAIACAYLASTVHRRPGRALRHALRAWHAQSDRVLRAAAAAIETGGSRRSRSILRSRNARLATTALTVEGWLGNGGAVPTDSHAALVRQQVTDAHAAIDTVVESVHQMVDAGVDTSPEQDGVAAVSTRVLRQLADCDHDVTQADARRLLDWVSSLDWWPGHDAARRLAGAVLQLAMVSRERSADGTVAAPDFDPALRVVAGGSLTGAAAVAALTAPGGCWAWLHRMDLPTRQAMQATVAMGLAILAGRMVSPHQFYWALIAVFIVYLGPATRVETAIKGFHRVLGTVLGIAVAVPLTELLRGHPLGVICLVLACCLLGYYLSTVSYSYLMF